MKSLAKRIVARLGYSLSRVPPGIVVGHDLARDLSLVMGPRRSAVCVDAGAHDGHFVDFLLESLNEPMVHAFEPAPGPFARLKSRHGKTPGITLVNAGLGRQPGRIEFNIYDNQTLNSFLPMLPAGASTLGDAKLVETLSVPVFSLDSYAASSDIAHIDLLKIDTQGYELQILEGAGRLLSEGKVGTVLVEINFAPLYERQVWAHEVIGFLHDRGLHLVDFYEKCRLNPLLGWCTALFTRRAPSPA
jgi:FkbM family methyltransferase